METTGERIATVIRIAGYENFPASIDIGNIMAQGETTSQTSTASLGYIQSCVDTELGFLWQDATGVLNFRNSTYVLTNPTSAISQGIVGDNPGADMFYIPKGLKIPSDALDLWTDIQVQANSAPGVGVMQEVINNTAVGPPGGWGKRVLQRTGLLFAYDSDAAQQAQTLSLRYANPRKRVDGVTLQSEATSYDGATPGVNIPFISSLGLWDRVTFQRQGSRESLFSADMLIEHREFKYAADPGEFSVTYILSPYEVPPAMYLTTLGVTSDAIYGGTPPDPTSAPYYHQAGEQVVATNEDGAATIDFPVDFPTGLLTVVITDYNTPDSGSTNYPVLTGGTNTYFTIYWPGAVSTFVSISWMADGW
jgi:hypothetical protein